MQYLATYDNIKQQCALLTEVYEMLLCTLPLSVCMLKQWDIHYLVLTLCFCVTVTLDCDFFSLIFLVSLWDCLLLWPAALWGDNYLRRSCCRVQRAHPAARFWPGGTRLVGLLQWWWTQSPGGFFWALSAGWCPAAEKDLVWSPAHPCQVLLLEGKWWKKRGNKLTSN